MLLLPGARLGVYEILSPLGAGGMGEVYRARDTKLGRDVALKVLPSALAADAGRFARFDREARAIAALNHPHIVTIYSLGTMPYVAPEQVEGRPVDVRSDLFSLGVMFYELPAGARPFQGSSSAALVSSTSFL